MRIRFAVLLLAVVGLSPVRAQRAVVSDKPDTPFSLVTVEIQGRDRIGMVLGDRVLDVADANARLTRQAGLAPLVIPGEMRELIEQYRRVAPRLYQIANGFTTADLQALPFALARSTASIKAPIKYPWNLLGAAVNYKSHAMEMGTAATPNPDVEDPVFFAKSPRSCIIDPGAPFYITPGRNIDWEGELAIIVGRPARNVSLAQAHDYVFGYSILHDVSDRGGEGRPMTRMFPGPNWLHMKSHEGADVALASRQVGSRRGGPEVPAARGAGGAWTSRMVLMSSVSRTSFVRYASAPACSALLISSSPE